MRRCTDPSGCTNDATSRNTRCLAEHGNEMARVVDWAMTADAHDAAQVIGRQRSRARMKVLRDRRRPR